MNNNLPTTDTETVDTDYGFSPLARDFLVQSDPNNARIIDNYNALRNFDEEIGHTNPIVADRVKELGDHIWKLVIDATS